MGTGNRGDDFSFACGVVDLSVTPLNAGFGDSQPDNTNAEKDLRPCDKVGYTVI